VRIVNAGRGIHQREIPGIDRLRSLPNEWIAFTNLDLSLPQGSREIDVILIADDRIMVIDLKDWRGKIESDNGSWIQNGYDKGRSPVGKINENAKAVYYLLKAYLSDHIKRTGHSKPASDVPRVQGLVLLTATNDISGIAPTESASVYCIDPFLRIIQQPGERVQHFRPVPPCFVDTPSRRTTGNRSSLSSSTSRPAAFDQEAVAMAAIALHRMNLASFTALRSFLNSTLKRKVLHERRVFCAGGTLRRRMCTSRPRPAGPRLPGASERWWPG